MDWNYYRTPKRWESVTPHGYFIVIEQLDIGAAVYAVYEGHFDDRQHPTGDVLKRRGQYATLNDAKKYEPS